MHSYGSPTIKNICVFCGSHTGGKPEYSAAATRFGQEIANAKVNLIYGGGRVGLMGTLADAVLSNGGRVTGIMPRGMVEKGISHKGLSNFHVVASMHECKAMMADLADAFVLLPGGIGNWEEFFEIVTWAQLGIHKKPCAVLNTSGYYNSLFAMAAHSVAEGFVRPAHQEMIVIEDDVKRLLARLASAPIPQEMQWMRPSER